MLRLKNAPTNDAGPRQHHVEPTDEWQIYVDLFADTSGDEDAPVVVPLFPCADFVPGNVGTLSAKAARALAGIGTPEEVANARRRMLIHRSAARH